MRKSKNSARLRLRAANDASPQKREVKTDFPADFPLMEIELEIVETYLFAIITELATGPETSPANDNMPGGECKE